MNPYTGANFFTFFWTLFSRFGEMLRGNFASDEIQLLTLFCISISSVLVGAFLYFRRMTMLANSLSHTILLGIAIAFIVLRSSGGAFFQLDLSVIVLASLITGLLTTLITNLFTHLFGLQEDASIGLVFTTLFALGVVVVTLYTKSAHIGLEAIMGNIDALTISDLQMSATIALVNLGVITLCFRPLFLSTFDSSLAKTFGISAKYYSYLLMFLTSISAITAFRAVGVFLFLALLVGPVIIARQFANKFSHMLILAPLIGMLISLIAIALSRHCYSVWDMPLSTSGLVVSIIAVLTFAMPILKLRRAT